MTGCIRQILLTACVCSSLGGQCLAAQGAASTDGPDAKSFGSQKMLWSQMTLQEKSMLWPMLTNEERMQHWRYMSKQERMAMRRCMTPDEQKVFRDRFVTGDCCEPTAKTQRPVRKMTQEERETMRNQIREVHSRMREGLNYSCTDPTDCPSSPLADSHAPHMHSLVHARSKNVDPVLPSLNGQPASTQEPSSNVLRQPGQETAMP